jgi:Fis family transcriptional regulator
MKSPITSFRSEKLSKLVADEIETYLLSLEEQDADNLYRQTIDLVEAPLIRLVMEYTHGNQLRAAAFLGFNKAVLRSKLKRHRLPPFDCL